MDSNDFFATAPAPASRFSAPPPQPAPPAPARPAPAPSAPSASRWHATATTFGPAVKVPVTLVVLLAALWGPVHSLFAHPPSSSTTTPGGGTLGSQVANAVGGAVVSSQQSHAVVQKVTTLVTSGAHALSNATSAFTWSWHLVLAAVLLSFLWQPGRRGVRR